MKLKLTSAAILFTLGVTLSGGAIAQQTPAAKADAGASSSSELKTQKDKASYAIGTSIGRSLQRDGIEVDPNLLLRGLNDQLSGGKLLLNEEETKAALTTLQEEARAKKEAEMKALGEANQKEGEAYLAANKAKEGVVTLPSGLEYKVIKQGDGPKPTPSDMVECNYRGTLINGKEFDSSYKRGKPATFPVSGVIKGWTEVLQLMPVGSKYQVVIPADLAYGQRGPSADIGPNATLIFEIELLSIKEKPATSANPHGPSAATSAAKPSTPAK
ncbi:MAG: FKBP-type peptidyl-prolyl cis-trans isomerase [Candidatus Korobacteraceae bacterium]